MSKRDISSHLKTFFLQTSKTFVSFDDDKNVNGYISCRQVPNGHSLQPFYADNPQIADMLLRKVRIIYFHNFYGLQRWWLWWNRSPFNGQHQFQVHKHSNCLKDTSNQIMKLWKNRIWRMEKAMILITAKPIRCLNTWFQ